MGGLNYPCAVQVMWVKVWEARRQNGSNVALDITSTQSWQHMERGELTKMRNERREQRQVQRGGKIKLSKNKYSKLVSAFKMH